MRRNPSALLSNLPACGLGCALAVALAACSAPGARAPTEPTASPPASRTPPTEAPPPSPEASASPPPPLASGWQAKAVKPTGPPPKLGIPPVRSGRVTLGDVITFEPKKATLRLPESEPALHQLKDFLDEAVDVSQIRIEGHTSSDGDDRENLELSGQRALAVVAWLTGRGIARDRLIAAGFGGTKPIAPNDTPENKARNVRIDVHVVVLQGKNLSGQDPSGGGKVFR